MRIIPLYLSIMLFISAVPWTILTWARVQRYARFFQQEGYETKRYLRWLWRNKAERRQLAIGCVIFAAGLVYLLYILQMKDVLATFQLPVVANVVLAIGAAFTATRDDQIKQKFAPTQRAVRLIVTTVLVKIWPIALAVLIFFFGKDPGSDFLSQLSFRFLLWAVVGAGAFAYFSLPLALPLAKLINWPIEETFRRLRPADTLLGGK